jgi:hypothetical protein
LDLERETWDVFTRGDGLVENSVVSIALQQDWLWVGTQGGVSRYDHIASEWQAYTTDDGLSSNHDVRVYVDGETVWAGTANGLSRYEPTSDNWQSLFAAAGVELAGVNGILADAQYLWISVEPAIDGAGGVIRLDKGDGEWSAVSGLPGRPPPQSYGFAQSEAALWAVPSQGLPWEHNKASGNWRLVSELEPAGMVADGAFQGAQFYAGALWLYAEHTTELVRYDPVTHQVSRYPASPLSHLGIQGQMMGHDDALWFTGRNGLVAFFLPTGEWRTFRRPISATYRILGERNGALLVQTDIGPGFWEPEMDVWQPLAPVGGYGNLVPDGAALEPGGHSVWLANLADSSEDQGPSRLVYFSRPGVEPQRFDLSPPPEWALVQLLLRPTGNTLWFLGNRGFLSYNLAIDQWTVFELGEEAVTRVWALQQMDNHVWFLTSEHLGRFDTNTGAVMFYPVPAKVSVRGDLEPTPDAVWLLIDGKLYYSVDDGRVWMPDETSLPCLQGATQLAFHQGMVWAGGTQGVGRRETDNGNWVCYGPAEGMLDPVFDQLYPTRDALWFGHPWRGIWQYESP